ncbi:MAG: hypothetical protein U0V48_06175 [Anaerolineales bacterium]
MIPQVGIFSEMGIIESERILQALADGGQTKMRGAASFRAPA